MIGMNIVKRIVALSLTLVMSVMLFGCVKYQTPDDFKPTAPEGSLTGLHHIEIEIQDYGVISVELNADKAPITVTNFIDLANSGFYNGLTFHRIMDGFMMQGGDPQGNGQGGSGTNIIGEFANNGYDYNDISHIRGTISMARANDYNSGSSQFFIVQSDSTFLDGDYAGFGHVTSGMDIVDTICANAPVTDNNGTVLPDDQPIITEIRVID
jgi:peptidyl-prolyl cis-trans isomerase B (cyclophilin B)